MSKINMSTEEASAALDSVYADVFFSKMAEYGFVPQTQEDMLGMLESAAYLDSIPEQGPTKTASHGAFAEANAQLKQAMVAANLISPEQLHQQQDMAVKQAAFALAHEPELYAAVLALHNTGAN